MGSSLHGQRLVQVAQRKSTVLTWRGPGVRHPPWILDLPLDGSMGNGGTLPGNHPRSFKVVDLQKGSSMSRFKRLATVAAVLFVVSGISAFAVQAPASAQTATVRLSGVTDSGPYRILAGSSTSGKCLDITGVSYSNGALAQIYDCFFSYYQWNQLFYIYPVGPFYQIVAGHSGKCLDVQGVSTANYALYQQYDCLGASQTNQIFDVLTVSNGLTVVYATHSWKAMWGAGLYNGASVFQYPNNEYWFLSHV